MEKIIQKLLKQNEFSQNHSSKVSSAKLKLFIWKGSNRIYTKQDFTQIYQIKGRTVMLYFTCNYFFLCCTLSYLRIPSDLLFLVLFWFCFRLLEKSETHYSVKNELELLIILSPSFNYFYLQTCTTNLYGTELITRASLIRQAHLQVSHVPCLEVFSGNFSEFICSNF